MNHNQTIRQKVLERDSHACQKCAYSGSDLEIHHKQLRSKGGADDMGNLITLCSICHKFAPNSLDEFEIYFQEKIDGNILATFRKFRKSISRRTISGMSRKLKEGGAVSRPPFGYEMVEKMLIPADDSYKVKEIFEDFLHAGLSLNKLAAKYGVSVNGVKKILRNRTYLGDVKFAGEVNKGVHDAILEENLFNAVQEKLDSN